MLSWNQSLLTFSSSAIIYIPLNPSIPHKQSQTRPSWDLYPLNLHVPSDDHQKKLETGSLSTADSTANLTNLFGRAKFDSGFPWRLSPQSLLFISLLESQHFEKIKSCQSANGRMHELMDTWESPRVLADELFKDNTMCSSKLTWSKKCLISTHLKCDESS